jgi:hypothetical protein
MHILRLLYCLLPCDDGLLEVIFLALIRVRLVCAISSTTTTFLQLKKDCARASGAYQFADRKHSWSVQGTTQECKFQVSQNALPSVTFVK